MDEMKMAEEIVKRTGVSYAEAKEALDASHGDMLGAVIFLENKGKKVRSAKCTAAVSGLWNILRTAFEFLVNTSVKVHYEGKEKFSLPLLVVLVFFEFLLPAAVIALLFGCTYSIDKSGRDKPFQSTSLQNDESYGFNAQLRK